MGFSPLQNLVRMSIDLTMTVWNCSLVRSAGNLAVVEGYMSQPRRNHTRAPRVVLTRVYSRGGHYWFGQEQTGSVPAHCHTSISRPLRLSRENRSTHISCFASRILLISSGKLSMVCAGMYLEQHADQLPIKNMQKTCSNPYQEHFMFFRSNSCRSRSTPRVAPKMPAVRCQSAPVCKRRGDLLMHWIFSLDIPREMFIRLGLPPTVVLMWLATASTSMP